MQISLSHAVFDKFNFVDSVYSAGCNKLPFCLALNIVFSRSIKREMRSTRLNFQHLYSSKSILYNKQIQCMYVVVIGICIGIEYR